MRSPRTRAELERALARLPMHAAALDHSGVIVAVNEPWRRFGRENGLQDGAGDVGTSYLRVCQGRAARGTEGPSVARAILRIGGGGEQPFRAAYSCHAPHRARWFQVEVASLRHRGMSGVLVTHAPVTEDVMRRQVADAERRHIARELHDTTAQNLAAALLDLDRVAREQRERQGAASAPLLEAIALTERSLVEVRSLAYELAPPGFSPGQLVQSLKRLATTFARRTGLGVMLLATPVSVLGDGDLSLESAEALYRTAEESLSNARRHSGGSRISIRVRRSVGGMQLEVKDDGHGVRAGVEAGKGLADARERLEACGGRLQLLGSSGGTTVVASVPRGEEDHALDRDRG